eukprot:1482053-Rhodomonas_salina.2
MLLSHQKSRAPLQGFQEDRDTHHDRTRCTFARDHSTLLSLLRRFGSRRSPTLKRDSHPCEHLLLWTVESNTTTTFLARCTENFSGLCLILRADVSGSQQLRQWGCVRGGGPEASVLSCGR